MAPARIHAPLLDDPDRLAATYQSSSIHELAVRAGVSDSTVRRALIRHDIARLPRNRNRRPSRADVLDDPDWLQQRYETRSGVEIAAELGVSARTVYAAMDRYQISRRTRPRTLELRRPQLADGDWLLDAVERGSSKTVAAELEVNAGTVTVAYERAGIDPASTPLLYARGRARDRPSGEELREAWDVEGTFRGVGRRIGVAHTTAAVWLAEIGVFADLTPMLSRSDLQVAITRQWSIAQIATEHGVSAATVRIELHRHGLAASQRCRHRGFGEDQLKATSQD